MTYKSKDNFIIILYQSDKHYQKLKNKFIKFQKIKRMINDFFLNFA